MNSFGDNSGNPELERRFWNEQDRMIDELYMRPHNWRFVPELASVIQASRNRFVKKIIFRAIRPRPELVLDIGCGSGWFGIELARHGIASCGIDVSDLKIERARRDACDRGLDHLAKFEVADALEYQPDRRVDLVTAFGSIHHLPGVSVRLGGLLDRWLVSQGALLFVEPYWEGGVPPRLMRVISYLATRSPIKSWFDHDLYHHVWVNAAKGDGFNVMTESPVAKSHGIAGAELRAVVERECSELIERRYMIAVGHLTQAFYIYMRPQLWRRFYRLMLPAIAAVDSAASRLGFGSEICESMVLFGRRD